MATILKDTLKAQFEALQAERARNWTPAQLEGNARQRHSLRERFDPADVAQVGDVLPPQDFAQANGNVFSLDTLTANGPALLIFFRFAGCPACNIALPYYADTLYPALRDRGIPLVALSPQQADRLDEIRQRHNLPFPVATDEDNSLARELGIAFRPDDRPSPPPAGWIGEVTGTGSWELPQPAVLLVGPGRVVRWLAVSPDWLDRPEADEILRHIAA
ncbi:AhpC/TSA family protein [Sphingobium terrigena]|uniref:AhpC/TSA family protein n=1 Tax=Sphingobium terrigena TaxID=2304063 RepID=A0A418YVG3_9SPHN|nr:peroxiredoxin-like family protein [Sphingobium terrigena]RJG56233.1 AhpC/TSA family protein [Sphingobium terrigena]